MTKKILLIVLFFTPLFGSSQSVLKLEKDTLDVGTVTIEVDSLNRESNSVYRGGEFDFINSGNEPLIITNVAGSGNAIAEFTKEPVLPGKSGTIKLTVYRYRYDKVIQKDGSHSFCTCATVQGNFKGESKQLCLKGFTRRIRKK